VPFTVNKQLIQIRTVLKVGHGPMPYRFPDK